MIAAPFLCGAVFLIGDVIIVALTIPQLPGWAQPGVKKWLFDIPQHSETSDNGNYGNYGNTSSTTQGRVEWRGYQGPNDDIYGIPFEGPIKHWSDEYEKPLLGCVFRDIYYSDHTGADFPVNIGTPIHATMGGEVVWAGENGPWGNLVVIENSSFQTWFAHLDSFQVTPGQIVDYGDIVGLSGNTGNSSGPHLHYGIKQHINEDHYEWVNPQLFFNMDDVINFGCSD